MNDKTIIQYDAAVTTIRTDPVYTEKEYTLFREDGSFFRRKGNCSIVDNGYNKVRRLCLRVGAWVYSPCVGARIFVAYTGTRCVSMLGFLFWRSKMDLASLLFMCGVCGEFLLIISIDPQAISAGSV